MNTYGHLLPEVHENAVSVLESISLNLSSLNTEKASQINSIAL